MTDILDILKKQAEAAKDGNASIKMAEHFEAIARQLREQAIPAKKQTFQEITGKNKHSRLDKFASAIGKNHSVDAKRVLEAAGFKCGFVDATGKSQWGDPKRPGWRVNLSVGAFTLHYHEEVKVPSTELEHLAAALKKVK